MVYGHNMAMCTICGRPYVTGDCIELDGTCGPVCEKNKLMHDLNHGEVKEDNAVGTCAICNKEWSMRDHDSCPRDHNNIQYKTVVDLTHLVSPSMKEKLKKEIQTIMNDALAGVIDIYRYRLYNGESYIHWGRVERHINEVIDLYWPKETKDE